MSVTISINRLKVYAKHGVLPQEQIVGANFYVSIEAVVNVTDEALYDDQLEGTVSYASLIDVILEEMQEPCQLLERVAQKITDKILLKFDRITRISIHLEKENPPLGVITQGVGVKLSKIR